MNPVAGVGGGAFGLGHDQGHLIADKAHHVGSRLGRAGTAQHRLVRRLQAVLVDRHVRRGENGDDTGHGLCLGGVDAQDTGVRPPGEEDLHIEHALHRQVTGILGLSSDLGASVHAGDRLTNNTRHKPSLSIYSLFLIISLLRS